MVAEKEKRPRATIVWRRSGTMGNNVPQVVARESMGGGLGFLPFGWFRMNQFHRADKPAFRVQMIQDAAPSAGFLAAGRSDYADPDLGFIFLAIARNLENKVLIHGALLQGL